MLILFCALAFLTELNPCFASTEEMEMLSKYTNIVNKASGMNDCIEKVKIISESIDFLKNNMPKGSPNVFDRMIAMSLHHKSTTLHNLVENANSTREQYDLLCQSTDCMKESLNMYKSLKAPQEIQSVEDQLNQVRYSLFQYAGLCALHEEDPEKSIAIFSVGFTALKENYPNELPFDIFEFFAAQQQTAIKKFYQFYNQVTGMCPHLKQQPNDFKKYQDFMLVNDRYTKMVSFFEQHLCAPIPIESNPQKIKVYKVKEDEDQNQQFSVQAEIGLSFFRCTNCILLKGASDAISNCAGANEKLTALFREKGQECLTLACDIYRKNIYQGEYNNNPEKEQEFILARLESLCDNPTPLKNFYSKLREETKARREKVITQRIRREQEAWQKQEAEKQKQAEEKRKEEKERAARLRALQAEKNDAASFESDSVVTAVSPSAKKETQQYTQKSVRVKTQGAPSPALNQNIKEDKKVNEIKAQIIFLRRKNYAVFQSLIGENSDRNISQKQVLKLLSTLKCKITDATGGGSHKKATAPNNKVWTIPPKWDAQIPSLYRDELNHYLLVDMGIIEGLLEVKERQ